MPGFAFPERVHRHSRPSGIKIIPVGGQRLGALDMDQFAEMAHLIRALQTALIPGKPLHQIKLAVIQAVDLFRPDPQQIAQPYITSGQSLTDTALNRHRRQSHRRRCPAPRTGGSAR